MGNFRIRPHERLQEWVAHEHGYFTAEGLDYTFVDSTGERLSEDLRASDVAPVDFRAGAFESLENGRACDVSAACHWAVNMASSAERGRMWGQAYSVTPAGIYVAPESPIRTPEDLAGVEIAVGWHSGSHFSALQALEPVLPREQVTLRFVGGVLDRLGLHLDRKVAASNVFGVPQYVLEQQGFRKVVDTSFMIGFMVHADAAPEDVAMYFRALRRAQADIDLAPERYKHFFLKALPERYHGLIDVRKFGPGERIVFEPYTRAMYEATHRWMESLDLFAHEQVGAAAYEQAVLA